MSFCDLIKEISPNICILCVRVKINKRSFEPFCVWRDQAYVLLMTWLSVSTVGQEEFRFSRKSVTKEEILLVLV